jgi:hypothetical protein
MQFHLWRFAFFKRFLPPRSAQAPLIAGFQPRKPVLGHWGGQVISCSLRKLKELIGHDGAHCVNPNIVTANFATSGAVKPSYW